MEELEAQQTVIYESNTSYTQELQAKLASLTAELEIAKEQQVDLQPFKEYIMAQKVKMLQLQTALEEERCKVRRDHRNFLLFRRQVPGCAGSFEGQNGRTRR